MIIRALDKHGDWTFGAGKSNYLSGIDACAQDLKTRIKEFLNDCFFDVLKGIDWNNLIGSKDIVGIKSGVEKIIIETQNVTGVTELSASLDEERNLILNYQVTTVFTSELNQNGLINDFITFITDEDGNFLTTESGDDIYA